MEPDPPTPLSNAVSAAHAAARRGDILGVDHAYLSAHLSTSTSSPRLASASSPLLATAHCTALFTLGALDLATKRLTEYLTHTTSPDLQLLKAELLSATTSHPEATALVRTLRRTPLTDLQQAKLAHIAALAATDRNDYPTAESELDAAERHYLRANHPAELEQIGQARLLLDVRRNSRPTKLTGPHPHTPADFLLQANNHKRNLNYDHALALMTKCVTSYAIEPSLQLPVLHELTVLLVMTHQPGAARKLFPLLVAAAGPEALSTLPDATQTIPQDHRLTRVRNLIAANNLVEAEWLLGSGNTALWHLTAGELAYADDRFPQAAHHFRQAADRDDHPDIRALALQKLGDALADIGDEARATECWSQAHHSYDKLNNSNDIRIRLLRATPTAHDSRVNAAVRRIDRLGAKALPGLALAMDEADRTSDLRTAHRWLTNTIRRLPRDQAVWLMHATPDRLHHLIITRRSITHVTTDVHISALTEAIHRLTAWHPGVNPIILGKALTDTAELIALNDVLGALPPKATRIAIAPGNLKDIPFAGLPVDHTHHLGQTYALSTLPSLSELPALRTKPAVLTTRWQPAVDVRGAYERHLATMPRDRALQHALKEVADRHPADWACWALHGDAGVRTKAGALRRRLRKNGVPVPLDIRPKVFLSFAGKDRPYAETLHEELEARNVTAFLDEYEISSGDNIVSDGLATSDYHVLLWSSNTPTRDWMTEEWTSQFARELTRRRAFLFIVRLDEEPLPPLLAPRKHIDLVDAADRLVTTWRADRKSELPVLPQPTVPRPTGPTTAISVRSHDLGVTHVVITPLHLTGTTLYESVHAAMRLPAEQTTFDGAIGVRFSYQLSQSSDAIPNTESTVDLRSDTVDLEINVDSVGPRNALANTHDDGLLDVDQQRLLLVAAFRHLLP